MIALTTAYGLSREPFAQDIPVKDLYPLPGLEAFLQRFEYAIAQRLVTVVTGEVGAGKSTWLTEETLRKRFPRAQLKKIEGTGHFLMMEQPEAFNRILLEWLKSQKL